MTTCTASDWSVVSVYPRASCRARRCSPPTWRSKPRRCSRGRCPPAGTPFGRGPRSRSPSSALP
eukprot:2822157-Pyramimonas_sp.AAC.1